jgi:RNA polymerase Rpb1, domain 5
MASVSEESEIKLVETYLQTLKDEDLNSFPLIPKCNCCIRLEFDSYKLYKYGLTLRSIAEKLHVLRDCNFLCSPERQGIIDVFFDFPEDTPTEEHEEYLNIVKNVLMSFEITGIIGVTAVFPKLEEEKEEERKKKEEERKKSGKTEEEDKKYILETDGSNLTSVLAFLGVDKTRTVTNSLWEINTLFGIEATRVFLHNQILKIMSANGIYVHKKYIQLLADSMTYQGRFCPATRHGMNRRIMGTFCKASFEESLNNFIIAAIEGEKDNLRGISSRVILGQCGYIGSNYSAIVKKNVKEREEDESPIT